MTLLKRHVFPSLLIFLAVSGFFLILNILARGVRAETKAEPPITPEQMAAKDAAVTQCLMQQDVPVVGFGLKVICVKKDSVAWIR